MFGVVGEEKKIGMLTWRGAAAPPGDRRRLSPDFSSPRTFSLPDPSLYMQHITTNDHSGRRRYCGGHAPLNIPAQYSFSSLVRVPPLQLPNLLNTRYFCQATQGYSISTFPSWTRSTTRPTLPSPSSPTRTWACRPTSAASARSPTSLL